MKSERGQAALGIVLILAVVVIAFLLIGMAANHRGMQAGAEVIGESLGEAIDDVTAAELAASFWVNSQKLYPNKPAIDRHGTDAWAATNCYNNNGFFQMWQVKNSFGGWDLHGLCQDQDKLVYDIILRRDGKTNRYNFITAFKPKGGFLRAVINYIKLGQKGQQVSPPSDILIYVDDVLVP